jgi:phosphopentomutase
MRKRVLLLVIDSLGVGFMTDQLSERPQDFGANTFGHILDRVAALGIPNLEILGINQVLQHPRLRNVSALASYGKIKLMHHGADSYAGHQEIMGSKPGRPSIEPFRVFLRVVKEALEKAGYFVEIPEPDRPYLLVNHLVVVADNIETDYGQIYNVTAPLDQISFDEVKKIGLVVRANVQVNRVIALGGHNLQAGRITGSIETREDGLIGVNSPQSGVYDQGYQAIHLGYNNHPEKQVSHMMAEAGKEVVLIGKMQDLITCGNAQRIPAVDTKQVMEAFVQSIAPMQEGLIAGTVQETDLAGHAQDVQKYASKIQLVDRYLKSIMNQMTNEDLLIITADHGNDPTIGHSMHTREETFLLVYCKQYQAANLGVRDTLSDIAATIADYHGLAAPENGKSFLTDLASA